MTNAQTDEPTPLKPLRLWPGVLIVVLQWLVRFAIPSVAPGTGGFGVIGALLGGLLVVLWWLFLSRAAWSERLGAIILMIAALLGTSRIVHESIATGLMGMMLVVYSIPVLSLALVAWAAASRGLSSGSRRASLVVTILLACGGFTLLRTGGITGDVDSDLHWRWTPSPEERLLAQPGGEPSVPTSTPTAAPEEPRPAQPSNQSTSPTPAAAAAETPDTRGSASLGDEPPMHAPAPAGTRAGADWPGFRGPRRDSVVRGPRIETNWSASPPVKLWRQPIGPGWSSFAVSGDLLYTQEQRGDEEIVACYKVSTGAPVWKHRDAARFWESNGGAGPRATPTLSDGRVYTFGATGILNALDAGNGAVAWSRNAASDTGTPVPVWGFASSPLVVDDVVIVHTGVLVAYDLATGDRRWIGATRGGSYSSPHLLTIGGVAQVLLMNDAGATSVAPADGRLLWEHPWPGAAIVQPSQVADGDVLITTASANGGIGARRLAVAHAPGGWTVEERWTSSGLKPYFNDFVVHNGLAFGFDGSILACIDLKDGKRTWKGGRYGNGQLVLLRDQDLLLVLSEEGELALVGATPDQFTEIARVPAIEGKTWNHPVLVGDVLLVRNGQEMAAFRLPLAGR